MLGFDPEVALPTLYGLWNRYADSANPGEQRIAEVVKGMIDELEANLAHESDD